MKLNTIYNENCLDTVICHRNSNTNDRVVSNAGVETMARGNTDFIIYHRDDAFVDNDFYFVQLGMWGER